MAASPNDMSCKELVELVTDYLEGALSPADQRRFELHLGKCEGCKVYIDQIRLTIKAAGQLTEDSIGVHCELLNCAKNRVFLRF